MKDSDFKKLDHQLGKLRIASNGTAVTDGYKPDLTVSDSDGKVVYILESEQKTDRKAYLGDLLKAEKYAKTINANPCLIVVMKESKNTTLNNIANQFREYASWLHRSLINGLSISSIQIISDVQYKESVKACEEIGSEAFLSRVVCIAIAAQQAAPADVSANAPPPADL